MALFAFLKSGLNNMFKKHESNIFSLFKNLMDVKRISINLYT